VCNGSNGTPNIDCRPNVLHQVLAQSAKEEEKFAYPKQNGEFVLPDMPECTGLNGTRKGPGADCRQVGRFTNTGNWFAQVAKEEEGKAFTFPK